MDIGQLLTGVTASINVPLLLVLMALGYFIKHWPILDKIENNLIPIVLIVIGIAGSLLMGDTSTKAAITECIMSGIVNAAIAVMLHQQGKNIFEMVGHEEIQPVVDKVLAGNDDRASPNNEIGEDETLD